MNKKPNRYQVISRRVSAGTGTYPLAAQVQKAHLAVQYNSARANSAAEDIIRWFLFVDDPSSQEEAVIFNAIMAAHDTVIDRYAREAA